MMTSFTGMAALCQYLFTIQDLTPFTHWQRIRTNNPLERILREVRRRTRVVGAFPDGNSALMLVAARLRHIAGTKWGTRRYLNMKLLKEISKEELAA
jgi:transposase-like protein